MILKIVNPITLQIENSYEADNVVQYGGSWGQYPHIAVPEGLDPDCVKAEQNGTETITIIDVPEQVIPAVTHEETVVVVDVPAELDEEGNVITPAVTHEEVSVVVDVPEQIIPAVTHTEERPVYVLVEDADKVAAKAVATKVAQCEALERTLWSEILAEMSNVYGTNDMNSATAYYLTWKRAKEAPAAFAGTLFADEAAVLAWCEPLLAAADAFAVWRLGKIATCDAAKQAIMQG